MSRMLFESKVSSDVLVVIMPWNHLCDPCCALIFQESSDILVTYFGFPVIQSQSMIGLFRTWEKPQRIGSSNHLHMCCCRDGDMSRFSDSNCSQIYASRASPRKLGNSHLGKLAQGDLNSGSEETE